MYKRNAQIINQQFLKYFLPTVMMTMALSMSIVVDGIIVGNLLGTEALAAVNIVTPVTLIFNAVYALIGVGGSTLFSVALGKQDKHAARGVFSISVVVMAVLSIVLLVASKVAVESLSSALTANAQALTALVHEYMGKLFWGAPFLILVPGLVYFLRAAGRPKLSSATLIVANVINLCLDVIFIQVFKMGIGGAALATVVGYAVGFIMVLVGIGHTKSLRMGKMPNGMWKMAWDISATGFPSALAATLGFLRLTFLNQLVMATLGTNGAVAFSVCISCLSLTSMFVGGAAQTMIPFLGTLYGEKDNVGMRFTTNRAVRTALLASVALLLIFELFPAQISTLFGVTQVEQVAIAVQAIRIYSLSLPFMGFLFIVACVYQVRDKKLLSALVTTMENIIFIVPLAVVLSELMGASGIWMAFPLAELSTLGAVALMAILVRRKQGHEVGILLLEEQSANILDVSIAMDATQVTELSAGALVFCKQQGMDEMVANRVAIAIEELAMNTITHGETKGVIDVRLSFTEEVAIISMRDNAKPLDPMQCMENDQLSNINMLVAFAKDVKYDRLLGMNCTHIEIAR